MHRTRNEKEAHVGRRSRKLLAEAEQPVTQAVCAHHRYAEKQRHRDIPVISTKASLWLG